MWKNNLYSFFIPRYEDLYDMLENGYNIHVDTKCFATEMKKLSPKYKKYNLHHKVIANMMNTISFKEFLKIPHQSTTKNIYGSLVRIYEGYQQIRESKVGLLIQQYEIFKMNND